MLKVMIVEDERPILDFMKLLIDESSHFSLIGAFTNPQEALEQFASLKPDAVFLDIEMPKMNGLELAEELLMLDEDVQVVFTTAYPQYALDAFRVNAVDYLLKPVTSDAIEQVAGRLLRTHALLSKRSAKVLEPQIRCLGTFEVRGEGGNPLNWPTKKTEELLAYLLTYPNQIVSKWKLAGLLWPDMEEGRSVHNLHNTVYRLKKTLKEQSVPLEIKKTNEGYLLNLPSAYSDMETFRETVHRLSAASLEHAADIERVYRMYEAPLFGERDYVWSIAESEELSRLFEETAKWLIDYCKASQETDAMERTIKHYLKFDPLHEGMNMQLLRHYSDIRALELLRKHYEELRQLLKDELGVEPPSDARQLMKEMELL